MNILLNTYHSMGLIHDWYFTVNWLHKLLLLGDYYSYNNLYYYYHSGLKKPRFLEIFKGFFKRFFKVLVYKEDWTQNYDAWSTSYTPFPVLYCFL